MQEPQLSTTRPSARRARCALRVLGAGLLAVCLPWAAAAQGNEPLPPAPTGTPLTVHGNIEGPNRLVIVQICEPGGACRLAFVDTLKQDDVPALVLRQRGQGRPGTDPSVTVLALCAGNWVAAVQAGQGQDAAQGMVCGYPTEMAALKAAFSACDSQAGRSCAQDPGVRASWGLWDGRNLPGRDETPGKLYDTWAQDGARQCQPNQAGACQADALEILRKAGVLGAR